MNNISIRCVLMHFYTMLFKWITIFVLLNLFFRHISNLFLAVTL